MIKGTLNSNEKKERKTRIRTHEKVISGVTYMTTHKAAEVLGVSRNCVLIYARLPKNHLKHLDFGGFKYFRQEWINEFIEDRIK